MDFHIRFSFDAPRGAGARIARFFGVPIALVMAAGLAAYAYDTTWVASNQPISASKLKANLDEAQSRLAALEDLTKQQASALATLQDALAAKNDADPACPRGYVQNAAVTGYTVCTRGADEMVKVGVGLEAFWVDRYEATVWSNADGTGTQYGATSPTNDLVTDYPSSFHRNGQRDASFVPLYAVSKASPAGCTPGTNCLQPSASLTWFQAMEACAASGKRLPDGQEWLRAASGTNDPGANGGGGGACVTKASGPRGTGLGTTCVSAWGAQDMIGNLWERTSEWYAGAGQSGGTLPSQTVNFGLTPWPSTKPGAADDYRGDGTDNVPAAVHTGLAENVAGLPAAVMRGGGWESDTRAGVFAMSVFSGPVRWNSGIGFRCVVR